jgi:hypothetical protein
LYEVPEICDKIGQLCYQRVTDPQFSWDTVASQFGGIFEDVMKEVDHSVSDEISEQPKRKPKRRKSPKRELANSLV